MTKIALLGLYCSHGQAALQSVWETRKGQFPDRWGGVGEE